MVFIQLQWHGQLVFGLQKAVTNAIVLCSFSRIRIALDDQQRTETSNRTPGIRSSLGLISEMGGHTGWAAWPRGSTTNVPGWLSFPHYIFNFTDVTFHFKRKSIFRLANRHKCCIHSPKCYTNITGTFCPQQGKRGCLNTFCSNRNKRRKESRKGQEEIIHKHLIMEMENSGPSYLLGPCFLDQSWQDPNNDGCSSLCHLARPPSHVTLNVTFSSTEIRSTIAPC